MKDNGSLKEPEKKICTMCYYVGSPEIKFSFLVDSVPWVSLIIPAFAYTIWNITNKYEICPRCKQPSMVSIDVPSAQRLLKKAISLETTS